MAQRCGVRFASISRLARSSNERLTSAYEVAADIVPKRRLLLRRKLLPSNAALRTGSPKIGSGRVGGKHDTRMPLQDREASGQGFTHKIEDTVTISSEKLGALTNQVVRSYDAEPWAFCIADLMRT